MLHVTLAVHNAGVTRELLLYWHILTNMLYMYIATSTSEVTCELL